MTGVAALALCAAFTSCSKNEELYDPGLIEQNEIAQVYEGYNRAFIQTFGQPAANHNWGFKSVFAGTRGDSEYANGNMWAAKDDGKYLVPDPLSEGQKARVQYFYQMNQKNSENKGYGNIDFFMQQVYTGGTDPTGESPEKYRSIANKLRYQQNGTEAPDLEGGIHMDHLTAGTANAHINNFNGGSCGTYPNILNNDPVVLAAYPNASEGGYLANQNDQYHHADEIELMLSTNTNYFGYANSDDSDVRIDRYWQVSAETIDNYITSHQSDYNTWLAAKITRVGHNIEDKIVNDFWGKLGRGFIGFDYDMLITGSCFATKTWDGDNIYLRTVDAEKGSQFKKAWKDGALVDYDAFNENYQYNGSNVRYLIDNTNFYSGEVETLTLNDLYVKYDENGVKTTTDGNIWYAINLDKIKDMLDRDFLPVKGKKLEEWVKIGDTADGYYSDWIVTFMPALHYTNEEPPTPNNNVIRIMAEDLNAKANKEEGVIEDDSDWDFNDVVLDVTFLGNNRVEIEVVAAGGTLPLRINGEDALEVHGLFDQPTDIMINTCRTEALQKKHPNHYNTTNLPKFERTIAGVDADGGRSIKLEVKKKLSNGNEQWFEMTARQGSPAAKFAVKQSVDYCNERQQITSKYPMFGQWVENAGDLVWWNPKN